MCGEPLDGFVSRREILIVLNTVLLSKLQTIFLTVLLERLNVIMSKKVFVNYNLLCKCQLVL